MDEKIIDGKVPLEQLIERRDGEYIAPENLYSYYKNEITRVEAAIEDAKRRMHDLSTAKIMTGAKASSVSELNYAIAIGKIYLNKLKNKIA